MARPEKAAVVLDDRHEIVQIGVVRGRPLVMIGEVRGQVEVAEREGHVRLDLLALDALPHDAPHVDQHDLGQGVQLDLSRVRVLGVACVAGDGMDDLGMVELGQQVYFVIFF